MKKFLILLVLFCGNAMAQIADGTYSVTETYKVSITYVDFPTTTTAGSPRFTGIKTFTGTVSGSVQIKDGAYTLVDKLGFTPGAAGS